MPLRPSVILMKIRIHTERADSRLPCSSMVNQVQHDERLAEKCCTC